MASRDSDVFVESLINYVRQHECLFDPGNFDYRNSEVKDRLWAEFGAMVVPKLTSEQVYKKWISLKQSYCRELRARASPRPTSGGGERKTWRWFGALGFLDGVKRTKLDGNGSMSNGSISHNAATSEIFFSDYLDEITEKEEINGSIKQPKLLATSKKTKEVPTSPGYFVLNPEIQANPFKPPPPLLEPPDELTYYLLSLKPSLERLKADRDLLEETKIAIQKTIFEKSKLLSN